MIIKIAKNAGFCFGVKRAVTMTEKALEEGPATSMGQLIHNKDETDRLKKMGLYEENEKIKTKNVIIRAHGLPNDQKDDIMNSGNQLIDATCPVLLKIYGKIRKMEDRGYRTVIIGDPTHPEIIAMKSYGENPIVVETREEANAVVHGKFYVISQTTNQFVKFKELSDIIVGNNTDVIVENTICNATKVRQEGVKELAQEVDAMIIIGGMNSSNTNKLFQIAKAHNPNSFRIENYRDLPRAKVLEYNIIGLSAGASTPDWVIEEVVNVMENYSKDEFMEQVEESMNKIYPREIVKGTVIYVTDDEVMVNIGYKSDGIINRDELSSDESKNPKDLFSEGDDIEVYVIKLDDGEGNVVLSTRRVEDVRAWKELVKAYENEETVEAEIFKEVKGGLLAYVDGITAFIPGSHVADYFVKNLGKFVGETCECKIINIDERKRRLVISRKDVLVEKKQEQLDKAWENIEVDKVVTGTVQRLTDFGAFVDIGGVDGLIHISDISWNRISHPSDELKEGQEVEVKILRANRERNRISLGLKQLQQKPFEAFVENNEVGDVVQGTVVNLVDFGAFVRLKEGVEGLVHVSQISHAHVEKPSDELNNGDVVDVKILEINPEEKRIALSIKETKEAPKKPERKPRPKKQVKRKKPRQQRQETQDSLFDDDALNTDLGFLLDEAGLDMGDFGSGEEAETDVTAEQEEVVEEDRADAKTDVVSETQEEVEEETNEEETEENAEEETCSLDEEENEEDSEEENEEA
ncbi:MAG: bifunctional 4-hydroxy-3-methylbut-2-enyl diphosphate reductase/30S ribosomal protein S1 [Tissierellia bacterium]|nr:bifunctional 4-hydroxy-3-methylbut-2-enyl diphosphate reductase/30S ribosomal protein S1 [Tissierellia bacterium]